MTLVYYAKERFIYHTEYTTIYFTDDCRKITNKMIRHFKLNNIVNVEFVKRNNETGSCIYWRKNVPLCEIHLGEKKSSIGIICHELAHAWELKKYGKLSHTKRHAKLMKRLIDYSKKKNYWLKQPKLEIVNGA